MVLLLALYAFGGLLLASLGVPFILHKIPPNAWFGIMLRSAQEDRGAWYRVNAFAGRRMLVVGLGTAIGAIILYYTSGQDVRSYGLSCLGLLVALFLWAIITIYLYTRSIHN